MKKTVAVIFDFDGVLVESVDVKTMAFAQMYAPYGADVVRRVVDYHKEHGGVSRFEKFRRFHEMIHKEPLPADQEKALGEVFSRLVKDAVVNAPWVPGAREFLKAFHAEMAMFVASGTPEEEMREIVHRRSMDHFFVSVHGSPASKAQIIDRICTIHGFEREVVLMVGDAITDYEGALSAGVRFVGRCPEDRSVFPPGVPVIADLRRLHEYC